MMDALARERAARFEAEVIAENAMRELWNSGHQLQLTVERLQSLTQNLDSVIEQRTSALMEANESLEHLASTIAHDVKSPLGSVALDAQLAQRALSRDEPQVAHRAMERIVQIAQSADELVGKLLHEVQTAAPARDPVDLGAIVDEVAAQRRVRVNRSVLPVVEGSEVLLRQLVENLIDNSIKYADPNRQLGIEVVARGGAIHFIDNGQGFPQSEAKHMFEPGVRLHDHVAGHGIGLATCAWIARRHRGHIRAVGEPKIGATFILELPEQLVLSH